MNPPTSTGTPVLRSSGGSTSWRRWLTSSVVASACGRRAGIDLHHRDGARRRDLRLRDRDDVRRAGRRRRAARRAPPPSIAAVQLGDEQQRAVEALSEALGEQVEGVARADARRVVAGVAFVQPQREHGRQQRRPSRPASDRQRPRARLHDLAPSAPRRVARRDGCRAAPSPAPPACRAPSGGRDRRAWRGRAAGRSARGSPAAA